MDGFLLNGWAILIINPQAAVFRLLVLQHPVGNGASRRIAQWPVAGARAVPHVETDSGNPVDHSFGKVYIDLAFGKAFLLLEFP